MKRRCGRAAGFGLIELLVVVVLIMLLAAYMIPRYTGGTDTAGRKVPSPTQRARQVEGVSYVAQLEMAISMYRDDHEGANPPNLQALKAYGITDEMMLDPNTRQVIGYDPQTGKLGTSRETALPQAPGF